MVVRSRGSRSRTRSKMTKSHRARGMPPVTHSLRDFPEGTRAAVVINPSVHKGMPHPRFQGLTGVIMGKRGTSFLLEIRDGGLKKTLIARPEHLRRIES